MKEYDAYLFDWDGTLARTLDIWLVIMQQTLADYGIALPPKKIVRNLFGRGRAGLLELGIAEQDLPAIFAQWDKTAQAAMETVDLYPHAADIIGALRGRGKKLALITATIRPTVSKALARHHLEDFFDSIIAGDEVKEHKPDPEGILFTLDKLGVAKDRAIMFGDTEKDIRAAHNAGIDSALFFPDDHHTYHVFDQLQEDSPTYTIGSWRDFLDQLQ